MDPEAIRDLFAALGPIRTRRMFGGQGIYAGDVMFALEAGGELYLKADESLAPALQGVGSRPFTYEKKDGRTARMNYWRLPDEAVDDPEEAARWGCLALESARRAAARKPKPRSSRARAW